jgi:hypothetical protein
MDAGFVAAIRQKSHEPLFIIGGTLLMALSGLGMSVSDSPVRQFPRSSAIWTTSHPRTRATPYAAPNEAPDASAASSPTCAEENMP